MFRGGVVGAKLDAHLIECGRRYEQTREAIREAKTDLTAHIASVQHENAKMDERNRRAIAGIYKLLWGVLVAMLGGAITLVINLIKISVHFN